VSFGAAKELESLTGKLSENACVEDSKTTQKQTETETRISQYFSELQFFALFTFWYF
jgi:hypothetical protein